MKAELKITVMRAAFLAALFAIAYCVAGCSTPQKVRDIELKGMYVNGYSEVLAIGSGKLTSIPGDREALAAHYDEDTAWLQPNVKTHSLDIFLVGTNSVENSKDIIRSICEAFKEVAPTVVKENAEVSKSVATATPLGVVQSGGEVRKAVNLAKSAAGNVIGSGASQPTADTSTAAKEALTDAATTLTDAKSDCTDGSCTTGACTDGSCNLEVK